MGIARKTIISPGIRILICLAAFFFIPRIIYAARRPNILFIIVDTLRSDHVGCYGYKNIQTPNIDSLASRGVLFTNAISQTPLTFPSHVTIFTSQYPQFHQERDNGNYRLDESSVTLAERLKQENYVTAAFVSSFVLEGKFGLNKGFDVYDDKMLKNTKKRIIKLMDEERPADQVNDAAIGWLKENKDKNFFLWVHYYDPHTLYNPPQPYKERYKDNLYDGEIAFVDEKIGELLSAIKECGLDKDLFIIFASDHGEGLGEHNEAGHGIFIYDSTLKVPLIFSYPEKIPGGRIIQAQVRLADIMPTVLDLLGMKKNKEIQGTSLADLIKGRGKPGSLPAYSESFYAKFHFNWSQLQSLRTQEWKYIKSSEPELYNIMDDPLELNNLAGERADAVKDLDKKLEKFLRQTESPAKEKKTIADRETRERLASLGYIQGAGETGTKQPVPLKMIQILEKMNLADRMANEGQLEEAVGMLDEVLKADPENMEAHLHLAQVLREQVKYDDAIRHFKKAASYKPDEVEVHNGLGNIYKSMGRAEEAFKEFELAYALTPDDAMIINNIGWYYQQKLEFDKAMEQYRKVLAIDDKIATTHANMGIIYRVKQNLDKAMEELNIAITLDPKLAFAYSELGACFATKGDLDSAISYCRKAIDLDPEGLDGYNNLGVCLERQGEFEEAIDNYKQALKIAPWNTLIYCNMGNAYIGLKEFDKAKESFQKALEIDPNCLKAANMLKVLDQKKTEKNLDKANRLEYHN